MFDYVFFEQMKNLIKQYELSNNIVLAVEIFNPLTNLWYIWDGQEFIQKENKDE